MVLCIYLCQVPNIVKALHRQMKEKSIKTRQGCFALLTELILVLPGALATHMEHIIGGIQFSLGELCAGPVPSLFKSLLQEIIRTTAT